MRGAITRVGCALALALSSRVSSAEADPARETLAEQVVDVTAPLLQLTLEYEWTTDVWNTAGDTQSLRFKPTVPFTAWGVRNIARLTLPYDTVTLNGKHGLDATELFDLLVFGQPSARWGIGPVLNFLPLSATGETLQAGPALGLRVGLGRWILGVFNRNYFSAGVARTWVQPILAYSITDAVALSLGDLQIIYDWNAGRFDQIPLGLRLDCTPKPAGQAINMSVNALYNFERATGQFQWRFIFGLALLVP